MDDRHRGHRARLDSSGKCLNIAVRPQNRVTFEEFRATNARAYAIDGRLDTLPLHRCRVDPRRHLDATCRRRDDDRMRDRMARHRLDRRRDAQKFALVDARHARDLRDFGPSACDRARLVDGHRAHEPERLEVRATFDEDTAARRTREAREHRRGCRNRKRAGRRADQHAHRAKERFVPSEPARERRHHDRGARRHEDARHVDARETLGRAFGGRLRRLRLGDEFHHARNERFARTTRDLHDQRAVAVQTSCEDLAAWLLLNRHALTGERALIDARAPFRNASVGRDPLAWPHNDEIARLDLLDGNLAFAAVGGAYMGELRRETRERTDSRSRAGEREMLKPVAE